MLTTAKAFNFNLRIGAGRRRAVIIILSMVVASCIVPHPVVAAPGEAELGVLQNAPAVERQTQPGPSQARPPDDSETPWAVPAGRWFSSGPSVPDGPYYGMGAASISFGPSAEGLGQAAETRFDPIRYPVQAGDVFAAAGGEQGSNVWHPLHIDGEGNSWYRFDAQARSYYVNDQRIEWSGAEETFGVEGAIQPVFRRHYGACDVVVLGEFYLNQPYDPNLLLDTPERRSYAKNFEEDTFQISQLYLAVRKDDVEVAFGKMVTPFGRTYFPLFTNSHFDAPFIRTEAIGWRETGLLLRYDPAWLVVDVALTNGGDDRDTNSSKALVSRVGFKTEGWAGGCSIKFQDGLGSEEDKEYDRHVGLDLMHRWGIWTLSGEMIFDEYGFHRPFDPNDITWVRSIYYRDMYNPTGGPITGVGYYINLGMEKGRWMADFCYGEFYPEAIGDPQQDVTNRRAIIKLDYEFLRRLDGYTALIVENGGYIAQANEPRKSTAVLAGMQYGF